MFLSEAAGYVARQNKRETSGPKRPGYFLSFTGLKNRHEGLFHPVVFEASMRPM
jgi:hypothetical protein